MKLLPRSDSTLQLARRLDWRFLLPEPSLQRVALFDSSQSLLTRALQCFSAELTLFENAHEQKEASFDLVVLARPALLTLEPALRLLAPGGHLYAEVQHAWSWRHERTLPLAALNVPTLADWQAELVRLGCTNIAAHWHRPTFEHALQIIPMHDAAATDFVFNRRAENLMGRFKFAAGRSLMQRAWLARLLQCVSMVASKAQ